jgi:hypothetical protein
MPSHDVPKSTPAPPAVRLAARYTPAVLARLRTVRGAALAGIAAGGLLAGHALDYFVVFPSGDHRSHVLAVTGHGYLPSAALVAVLTLLFGLAVAAVLGARDTRRADPVALKPHAFTAALVALQVGGFLALESGERLLTGAGLSDLTGPLLGVGIVFQVLVALAGRLLFTAFYRAGAAIGRRVRRVAGATPRMAIPTPVRERRGSRLFADRPPARASPGLLAH